MQKVDESGFRRPPMVVLTRWVVDPDVCGSLHGSFSSVQPRHTCDKDGELNSITEPGRRGTHCDAVGSDALGENDEDLPIGGWIVQGPGTEPITISLTDPQVPNFELLARVLFTLKIVDISATF